MDLLNKEDLTTREYMILEKVMTLRELEGELKQEFSFSKQMIISGILFSVDSVHLYDTVHTHHISGEVTHSHILKLVISLTKDITLEGDIPAYKPTPDIINRAIKVMLTSIYKPLFLYFNITKMFISQEDQWYPNSYILLHPEAELRK